MLKLANLRPIVPVSDHSHLVLAYGASVLVWTKIEAVSDFQVNLAAFVPATAAPLVTARSVWTRSWRLAQPLVRVDRFFANTTSRIRVALLIRRVSFILHQLSAAILDSQITLSNHQLKSAKQICL